MKTIWKLISIGMIGALLSAALPCRAQNWTAEDKETWKKAVKRVVMTPPCCGACGVVTMEEGRRAYKYVTGEETSSENEIAYKRSEKKLLEAFRVINPTRYDYWFGNLSKEDQSHAK